MSDDLFDGPGSADQFGPEEHEGRLLLIKPLKQLTGVTTVHGAKDAVEADIHILDGPRAGEILRGAYIFPLVLQGQVKGNVGSGRFNLGRLGKGSAKSGQKPPWKLSEPTADEQQTARRYLASDHYKNGAAAAPAPAPAAAPAQSDPWGAAPAPAATAAADPWGSSDKPPF
jgi:hypothetical protein